MSEKSKLGWLSPLVKVAAAGLGAVIAGPVGAVVGGSIGSVAFSEESQEAFKAIAEKFTEKAADKLLETGSDSLADKLGESESDLEVVYREALRASLRELPGSVKAGREDWFKNWDRALDHRMPLSLRAEDTGDLVPEKFDRFFSRTMSRLDAQGVAVEQKSALLTLKDRELPDDLFEALRARLPERLETNFSALIVKGEYEEAWKQAQLALQKYRSAQMAHLVERVDSVKEDTADTRVMMKFLYDKAVQEGALHEQQMRDKDAVIERLAEEMRKLKEEAAKRAHEPGEAEVSQRIAENDLAGALELKQKQVAEREQEAAKLPDDYFQLGRLYELNFDWPAALEAYAKAWEAEPTLEHGFSYAQMAFRQMHLDEASGIYEKLLKLQLGPAERGSVLNNAAGYYMAVQQFEDSEKAYTEAVEIYRKLADQDPDTNLPMLATTLNNVAGLYRELQRSNDAKKAALESLDIRRKLAEKDPACRSAVASSLQSVGAILVARNSFIPAHGAFGEALGILRELAKTNPKEFEPKVATALTNLSVVFQRENKLEDAAAVGKEAVEIRRRLAAANPDAYRDELAQAVTNLAVVQSKSGNVDEAEAAYKEAVDVFRERVKVQPKVYLSQLSKPLNNLAVLYQLTDRPEEALKFGLETVEVRRKLVEQNRGVYAPDLAGSLRNLGVIYRDAGRKPEAMGCFVESMQLLEPFWLAEPQVHGDELAKTYRAIATLVPNAEDNLDCIALYKAMEAAQTGTMRAQIQGLMDDANCGERLPAPPQS